MQYKVLYRKYRPIDFDNLVGQESIIKILKNSVINNKISHAYIFNGPRGTGKTSTAKIFAKNINCLNPKDGNACNECINCKNFDNSADIIELDAASNNGVDEIREITNNIKLSPSSLKYKVYIIDEVHMLTPGAFNAMLLTLEEPPKHAIFILATTNIESVPITILSRCQRFDFKKITVNDIVNRLKYVSECEKININDEAMKLIAEISDGGMRDSLSLLDQLSKENVEINEEFVSKYSGNIPRITVNKLLDIIEKNSFDDLNALMLELSDKNFNYKLLIKSIITESVNRVKKIISTNNVKRLSVMDYKKLVLELTDLQNKINVNVDVYSLLFVVLASYLKIGAVSTNVVNIDTINKNKDLSHDIEQKDNLIKETEVFPNDSENDEYRDVLINNCFALANKEEKIKQLKLWSDFINNCNICIKGKILDTEVVMASENIVVVKVLRDIQLNELLDNKEVLKAYQDYIHSAKKLVFINENKWNDLVEKFKKDRQSGIIYKVIDESIYENKAIVDISDIFEIDKIKEG